MKKKKTHLKPCIKKIKMTNKTLFEQKLEVALEAIGYTLDVTEYRQDILQRRSIEEAGNPFLQLTKEIAKNDPSPATQAGLLALSPNDWEEYDGAMMVRGRSGKKGNTILRYELSIGAEDEETRNRINSSDEVALEEMIGDAISREAIREKFRVYVPGELRNQEGLSRRQKMAAKLMANFNHENIIEVSSNGGPKEGDCGITVGENDLPDQPYNPDAMVREVVRVLLDYQVE